MGLRRRHGSPGEAGGAVSRVSPSVSVWCLPCWPFLTGVIGVELWSGARAEAEGQGPSLQEGTVLVLGKGRAPIADHIHRLDRSGKWIYLSPEKQQLPPFPLSLLSLVLSLLG